MRIACANAESDLAATLALYLPRGAEAKKTLANILAAPGKLLVGRRSIAVTLTPAGTKAEREAFSRFFADITKLRLSMPGDQLRRPLRFILAQLR